MRNQINPWMGAAAGLTGLTAAIHVFSGGPEVADPLRASALDPVVRSVMSVIWHGITVILLVFAAALARAAWQSNALAEALIGAVFVAFAALFVGYGLADLRSLWPMPQWIIFLTIPALMVVARRHG